MQHITYLLKTFVIPHMSYGANLYYPNMNDNRTKKFALEGINKIQTCFKKIVKNAFDIPQTLDNNIADNLMGKYSFSEKVKYT